MHGMGIGLQIHCLLPLRYKPIESIDYSNNVMWISLLKRNEGNLLEACQHIQ